MAVRKDKSANIHSFKDLAESNLRLGIGDAKAMALGKGAERKSLSYRGINRR